MGLDAVRTKTEQVLAAALAAAHPTAKINYENVKFMQPKQAPWVEVRMTPGKTTRADVGSRRVRHSWGVVNLTVLVPEETGTATIHNIGDTIENAFLDRNFALPGDGGYLTYYCVTRRNRGVINGFLAHGVMIEYRNQTNFVD